MIDKQTGMDILTASLSTGGTFAEIFIEHTSRSSIAMINGKVDKALSGLDYGAGIRIFTGLNAIYAYTNDVTREGLLKLAIEAAEAVKKAKVIQPIPFSTCKIENIHPIVIMPNSVEKSVIVEKLREISQASFAYSSDITQTTGGYAYSIQNVWIINSEGLWVEDKRIRNRVQINAIASSEKEKQTGGGAPGGFEGFELVENLDLKELGTEAAKTAVTMLHAENCPSGTMPVIIDNGFGGVIFHEACGHSLEATAIAKGASVFCGKLGEMIASSKVTAIDDGTIPNGWGSLNIDDEGTKTKKNILIENGVLKSYMVDKLNGLKMNTESTGSGRRESYRYAPTSRMTNTYIAPGQDKIEDMFKNTEYGLYAKKMGGGSVEPATGEFNFSVREGYLIEKGEITRPVRGATMIGKGSEVIKDIDYVADNLKHDQGMCGSISGSIAANVGQPTIRVKQLIVGGRG